MQKTHNLLIVGSNPTGPTNMTDEIKKIDWEKFKEFQELFQKAMKEYEEDSEKFWNSLSMDDQIKVFCAVSRRIYDGEVKINGTYRYVLYDVFGFDESAYAVAQMAGYLELHNLIGDGIEYNKGKLHETELLE
jgi:hypothetical protein